MSPAKLILIISIFSLSANASLNDKCRHTKKTLKCLKYKYNYDADTITFRIPNIHPILGVNAKVRLLGLDTPELRTDNDCEKRLGLMGKEFVANALNSAKSIRLRKIRRGKYFRIVADVYYDKKSLTRELLKRSLGYKYDGKKKPQYDWCRLEASALRYL